MFTGNFKVKICEAQDLRLTDCMTRFLVTGVGKSQQDQSLDPYVTLEIDEVYFNRTQVKQKTFTPVWNEWFENDVIGASHLGLKVFHDSAVGNDDFVADASVSLEDVIAEKNGHFDNWVRITLMTGPT